MRWIAITTLVLLGATPAAAQEASCPSRPARGSSQGVWLSCQTDSPPALVGDILVPNYPAPLLAAGLGGSVSLQVRVDTAGRAEAGGIRLLSTSRRALVPGVLTAIRSWRFTPAVARGARVRALALVVVDFVAPADTLKWTALVPRPPELLADRADPDSGEVLTVGWPAQDPAAARPSAEEAATARLLALQVLVTGLRREGDAVPIACVGIAGQDGDSDVAPAQLQQLVVPGVAVLPRKGCPVITAALALVTRPLVPWPGGDQVKVLAGMVRAWRKGILLVDGTVGRGPGGTSYRCWVDVRGTTPMARCAASRDLVP